MQVKSPKMMATKNISTSTGVKWLKAPRSQDTSNSHSWFGTKLSALHSKTNQLHFWPEQVRSWNENESQQKPYPLPTFLHLNVGWALLKELHGATLLPAITVPFSPRPAWDSEYFFSSSRQAASSTGSWGLPRWVVNGLFLEVCYGAIFRTEKISVYGSDSSQRLEDFKICVLQIKISCSFGKVLFPKESHRLAWTPRHHDCSVCLEHSVVRLCFSGARHWASSKEVGERQGCSNTLEGCIEQEKHKVFPCKTRSQTRGVAISDRQLQAVQMTTARCNASKMLAISIDSLARPPNTHPFTTCRQASGFLPRRNYSSSSKHLLIRILT